MMKPFDDVVIGDRQSIIIDDFRQAYSRLYESIALMPASRELSLAITNLEQSAMWLNKSISRQTEEVK